MNLELYLAQWQPFATFLHLTCHQWHYGGRQLVEQLQQTLLCSLTIITLPSESLLQH